MSNSVALAKLVDKMKLENLTPEVDISKIKITTAEINRPALQLTGYFDYFDADRVEIIGYVEYTYLEHQPREQKLRIYEKFLSYHIPCLIYTTMTDHEESYVCLHGGGDSVAECGAGALHFHPWRAGGRIRRGHIDHGRERHR